MLNLVRNLQSRLQNLQKKEIRIQAGGKYPNRTLVSNVAHWQNEGTAAITPAKFTTNAESVNNRWYQPNKLAVWDFLTGGGDLALIRLGLRVSKDIAAACNRIRTGRLKRSFNPEIKTR